VLRREVATTIERFCPRTVSESAARFAKEVVTRVAPGSAARAKALLFACSRLGQFGLACGLDTDPQVLLHPSVIERFVVSCDMSGPTRRTLRTNLRHVAKSVLPQAPEAARLSRERSKRPYSASEIAAYLALADAQPTVERSMRANGMICLGAGAGLMGADLRHVRGRDLTARHGGLLVEVAGRRPRSVPVLSRYHERLLAAARFAGGGYLIGGVDPERLNVTSRLTASLTGGPRLARIDTGRLRATWLVHVSGSLGLKAFMDAAGVSCSQRLGDLISSLEVVEEQRAVAILGGLS
jgi:integrase